VGCEGGLEAWWLQVAQCQGQRRGCLNHCLLGSVKARKLVLQLPPSFSESVLLHKISHVCALFIFSDTLPDSYVKLHKECQKNLSLDNSELRALFLRLLPSNRIPVGTRFSLPSRPGPRPTQPHVQRLPALS
jgi:hypothetical protein